MDKILMHFIKPFARIAMVINSRAEVQKVWPIITYGKNYNGTSITEFVRKEGMEQPIWYWNPSTAVCGIDFYRGKLFPKWNNKLLVGALKYEDLRVRDVVCGPDGAIYVVLNGPGTILRLTPKPD